MSERTLMRELQDEIKALNSTILVMQVQAQQAEEEEPTYPTDFHKALEKLTQAMALVEQIPEYLYPYADDLVSNVYNAVDDAICTIRPIVEDIDGQEAS